MKLERRVVIAVAGLVVLAGAFALGWKYFRDRHETSNHMVLLGNVDVRQVNLAFKVGGRIAAVHVEEGDAVTAGQIIATIEREDFEDEMRLARSRVEGSQAVLAALEAGSRPEEIEEARALVAQRQAALALAEATLKRQEALAAQNVASHQIHDEAQARLDEARAELRAAQEALQLAETGPRQEEIDQARARLNADQAALRLAERRLTDTILRAPNDGIILTRVREPGAIVAAGETICTLTLTSPIWVRAYVDEPDLGLIRAGMPAEVRTDSGGVYEGQVGFISPVAEFTPKTVETRQLRTSLVYRLRIIVDNPDNELKQGMPVTIVLASNGDA